MRLEIISRSCCASEAMTAVGVRHISGDERNAVVLEGHQEGGITEKAVQLGDQQRGASKEATLHGLLQLRPVVHLAAFDLVIVRSDNLATTLGNELVNGQPLSLRAKAGFTVPIRGNSQVSTNLGLESFIIVPLNDGAGNDMQQALKWIVEMTSMLIDY